MILLEYLWREMGSSRWERLMLTMLLALGQALKTHMENSTREEKSEQQS